MTTPFTPRPSSRSSHLGLSTKQYSKVANTLASVRRHRQYKPEEEEVANASDDEPAGGSRDRHEVLINGRAADVPQITRERPRQPKSRPRPVPEQPSFLAEASFVAAPLNSRIPARSVPSPISSVKGKEKEKAPSLRGVLIPVQEALVLEDLLFVLMGVPGTYISVHPSYDPEEAPEGEGVKFATCDSLDPSLRDLVDRMLPLATYYTAISTFVQLRSPLENGMVNHALCAAIRDMLQDYLTLISQLEHSFNTSPTFSLQKLWFYVQPTLHTLSLIYSLTSELLMGDKDPDGGADLEDEDDDDIDARDAALGLTAMKSGKLKDEILEEGGIIKGGEVVTLLWEKMMNMSGDPTAHELYRTLFRKSSMPYVSMIRKWTITGHLKDPYNELLVKEQKTQLPDVDFIDEYWEKRYTLRDGSTLNAGPARRAAGIPKARASGHLPGGACIPPLLDAWKHKILLAGKYLNVIRECGRGAGGQEIGDSQKMITTGDEALTIDDERFYKGIEDAYSFANKTLLKLLIDDQQLIPRLRSLKYYFFLSRSAFITHFLASARKELSQAPRSGLLQRLQSLFELAVTSSGDATTEVKTYSSDIQIKFETSTVWSFLTKVDGITGVPIGLGGGGGDDYLPTGTLSTTSSSLTAAGDDRKSRKDKSADAVKETLTVNEALTLDYKVKFPLSLVMSRKYILRYQLIFRFLLQLKTLEQELLGLWMDQKGQPWAVKCTSASKDQPRSGTPSDGIRSTTPTSRFAGTKAASRPPSAAPSPKELAFGQLERWKMRVIILRSRMLSFVQNVLYFATFEVIEPNWRELETKLGKVVTVDQLLKDHLDFLDTTLKGCMLTSAKSVRALSAILSTSHRYLFYSSSLTANLNAIFGAIERGEIDSALASLNRRWDFIGKFEMNFNHHVKVYTDHCQFSASSENTALLALVVRLNAVRLSAGPDA